jgi:hypothetical protein
MPTKREKCMFAMPHCIENNKVIIPLKTSDKCKKYQSPTSQKGKGNKSNH